jgi:hypothetical protein
LITSNVSFSVGFGLNASLALVLISFDCRLPRRRKSKKVDVDWVLPASR